MGLHTGDKRERSGRLTSILAEFISSYLSRNLNLPNTLITISRIELTPKGTTARIYISVFPDDNADQIISDIKKLTNKIKSDLAHHSKLRNIPDLIFEIDRSSDLISKIEQARK